MPPGTMLGWKRRMEAAPVEQGFTTEMATTKAQLETAKVETQCLRENLVRAEERTKETQSAEAEIHNLRAQLADADAKAQEDRCIMEQRMEHWKKFVS